MSQHSYTGVNLIYYPKQFIIFQASPCFDCSNSPLQGLMCPLWVGSYWLCYQIDYLKQLILSGQIVILHPPLHFQTIFNFSIFFHESSAYPTKEKISDQQIHCSVQRNLCFTFIYLVPPEFYLLAISFCQQIT